MLKRLGFCFNSQKSNTLISCPSPLHHSQEIVDAENRILAVEVRPTYEFTQLILSFGFDVKVLGPEPFKQEILANLRRNLQNYDEMQIDCTD